MNNKENQIDQENQERQHLQNAKDTTIGLVDIDYAIQWYIENKIASQFIDPSNQRRVNIDVFMKKPERWIDKKDVSKKDITGNHYKFPLIGINRNGIDIIRDRVPHWISDEQLSYIINKSYNFSHKKDGKPFYKMVRRPVKVDANYEFEIVGSLQSHVNYISEQFVYHEGKYWTDGETYSFRTRYQSVNDATISADQSQERLVISTINASCSGYILPQYAESEDVSMQFIQGDPKLQLDEKIVPADSIKEDDRNLFK